MKKNMGTTDKIIRLVLAIIFGVLYYTDTITGTWGLVLAIIAIVFLLTSLVSFCPLYSLLGINTLKKKKE